MKAARAQGGTIELCGKPVDYSVRTSTGAKYLRIRVTPNGVEVVIPRGGDAGRVVLFLQENERWVKEQLDFVERSSGVLTQRAKPRSLLLRGEERTIRIVEEKTTRNYGLVSEKGEELVVRVPTGNAELALRALELWLRRLARTDLAAALDRRAREMKVRFGRVYIMNQRTRWGGCSSRRNLSFNWRLVL